MDQEPDVQTMWPLGKKQAEMECKHQEKTHAL